MSEWTICIDSHPGLTNDDDIIMAVHDALNSDPVALGPSVSCHTPTETVSSTFQVEAEEMGAAADAGISAFVRAIEAAGLEDRGGRLHVELVEEEETPQRPTRIAVPA